MRLRISETGDSPSESGAPTSKVRTFLLGCLAGSGLACGDTPPEASSDLPACLPPPAAYSQAVFRAERSIGAAEARSGEPVFGSIQDLSVATDGRMYVIDGLAKQVTVLDPMGVVLDTLGRPGAGPGEFETPWAIAVREGNTATVFDAGLWRITQFAPDGEVSTSRVTPDAAMGQFPEVAIDASGDLLRLSYGPFQEAVLSALRGRAGVVRGRNVIQRWDSGAEAWVDLLSVPGREVFVDPAAGGMRDPPFPVAPVWTAGSDGAFWHGDGGGTTLTRYNRSGDAICTLTLDVPAVAITAAERDAYYNPDRPGLTAGRRAELREARSTMPMPEEKPKLYQLFAESATTLWLAVATPESSAGRVWLRVDLETGHVLRLASPEGFSLLHAQGDRVFGVLLDSLRTPYVGVYGFRMGAQSVP